jgi:subtilisin-like proprotein convertase family protein
MKTMLGCCLVVFLLVVPVRGDVMGSGSGFSIPDNNLAGVSSTITFSESLLITGNVVVTLEGMTHTWIGDLTATLIAPDNTSHDLFFRVGRITTGAGDSSEFNGDYIFRDAVTDTLGNGNDLWAEAGLGGDLYQLRGGEYRTTAANSAAFTSLDSTFAGLNTQGTWTLLMTDQAGNDVGSVGGWTLSMSAIPEPGSTFVLGGLGLAAWLVRRRR